MAAMESANARASGGRERGVDLSPHGSMHYRGAAAGAASSWARSEAIAAA
jgi:hypothetical protein